ncbi:aminoacyl-histidine dipeptidase, partial [Bacteroidota bacterium]
ILQLETLVDKTGNILIRKEASSGLENRKTVVLQAHLDMVPQKNSTKVHNFEKDPIEPVIKGEWVGANGTTLGADNGIGAAAIMAILESNEIEHGPIEALFTIDEETGMTGAFNISQDFLKGDILLNTDSEVEGELYIGSAGGIDYTAMFEWLRNPVDKDSKSFQVSLTGLRGGHSGMDINLERGNANKLVIRFLWNASKKYKIKLSSLSGGDLRNAIPRECFARFTVPIEHVNSLRDYMNHYFFILKNELQNTEPDLQLKMNEIDSVKDVLDENVQRSFLHSLYACQHGVVRVTTEMPEVPETSLNLAAINFRDNNIIVQFLLRSSVDSAKESLADSLDALFELGGAKIQRSGSYPGWKPDLDSEILQVMKRVYLQLYGKNPGIKIVHAGFETGVIGEKYPNLDMISFGPTIKHPHSPDEKVHIPSVQKFWDFLKETLKNIPVK